MKNEKETVMNETSWAMRRITDLRDMLEDGMPSNVRSEIYSEIESLEDAIFYNQEYLSTLEG